MEKLKLTCGRYLPSSTGTAEVRLAILEEYVSRLSAELEFRLDEAGRTLETLASGNGTAEAASTDATAPDA